MLSPRHDFSRDIAARVVSAGVIALFWPRKAVKTGGPSPHNLGMLPQRNEHDVDWFAFCCTCRVLAWHIAVVPGRRHGLATQSSDMNALQNIFFHGTALLAAILQLLYETAFGPSHACKSGQQNGRSLGTPAGSSGRSRAPKEQASLSDDALVRLCRGLQEELRRKDKELTTCKVSSWGPTADRQESCNVKNVLLSQ